MGERQVDVVYEEGLLHLGGGVGSEFMELNWTGLHSIAVVAQVWGSWTPSKVIIFSWQTLPGRLPTRENLVRRGVLPLDASAQCPCCDGEIESEDHLLVTCPLARAVWSLVHRWFVVISVVPSTLSSMCESFLKICRKGKNGTKGVLLVWHSVIWALWCARNDNIFSEKVVGSEEVFEKAQIISWKWLIAKKNKAPCLYYE
ncbi:hypothetical protein TSUD_359140 [Trifolium subterraneum]|uniref:Reverse transcriptase zinc-binding domain-containing protein n=1 Tax=Trifolium subterraneum TaxID=3900 RepID=A0A2Z6NJZ9_TRISU|nr:hypothetical protein TSUD_359140 [Trifolium subterraneum]